jgi:hypothetical protein
MSFMFMVISNISWKGYFPGTLSFHTRPIRHVHGVSSCSIQTDWMCTGLNYSCVMESVKGVNWLKVAGSFYLSVFPFFFLFFIPLCLFALVY